MKKNKKKNLIALFLFIIFLGIEFLIYFNNRQKYIKYQKVYNLIEETNQKNTKNKEKIKINEEIEKPQYEYIKNDEKILEIMKNKNILINNENNKIVIKKEKDIEEKKINIKKEGKKADLIVSQIDTNLLNNETTYLQNGIEEKTEEIKELDKWIKKSDYIFTESIKDKLIENDTNDYVKKIKNLVDEARQGEVLYDYNMEQEIKENLDKIYFYGDSNVKHFEYYNMLSYKYYGFLVSRIENQEKEIEKHIKKRNPKKIVFFNGYNIAYYKNGEEYVEQYKKIIQKIKSIDPKIKIYICSLLPAQEFKKVEDLHQDFPHNIYRGEEFDKALEDYFTEDEKGATYINTKWIIKEDYYGKDGVHMKKPFYKVLVRYIAYLLQII